MFQDLKVTATKPQSQGCCSLSTHWLQSKSQEQWCGQGQPSKMGFSTLATERLAPLTLWHIYTHTFLLLSLLSGVEATVLSSPWPLYSAELTKPQFSWAALLHNKIWVLLHSKWRTSYFLRKVFHNFHQILPWWPFPSVDGDSDATFLYRNVTPLSLQPHQPSLLWCL